MKWDKIGKINREIDIQVIINLSGRVYGNGCINISIVRNRITARLSSMYRAKARLR